MRLIVAMLGQLEGVQNHTVSAKVGSLSSGTIGIMKKKMRTTTL